MRSTDKTRPEMAVPTDAAAVALKDSKPAAAELPCRPMALRISENLLRVSEESHGSRGGGYGACFPPPEQLPVTE